MRHIFPLLAAAVLILSSCGSGFNAKPNLKTSQDSLSYACGVCLGNTAIAGLKRSIYFDTLDFKGIAKSIEKSKLSKKLVEDIVTNFGDVDQDLLKEGYLAQLAYGKTSMPIEQAKAIVHNVEVRKRQEQHAKYIANLEAGRSFLESNLKNEGVDTINSNLQYKIIKAGDGPKPKITDKVKINYRGTLIDGTQFDASKEGEPRTFQLRGTIRGWQEALLMMPVGSKWQIFVSSDLAYRSNKVGDIIEPGSTLIFDIELVEIVEK